MLGTEAVWEATVAHQALIMEETLADQFGSAATSPRCPPGAADVDAVVGDGQPVRILVKRL